MMVRRFSNKVEARRVCEYKVALDGLGNFRPPSTVANDFSAPAKARYPNIAPSGSAGLREDYS